MWGRLSQWPRLVQRYGIWDLSFLCSYEIIGDWTLPLDLSQNVRLDFSLFMLDHWGLTLPLDLSQGLRLEFSLFMWSFTDHWGLTLPLDLSQNVRLDFSLFMWDHWGLNLAFRSVTECETWLLFVHVRSLGTNLAFRSVTECETWLLFVHVRSLGTEPCL